MVVALLAATTGSTLPARFDGPPIDKADAARRVQRAAVSLISLGCDLSLNRGTGVAVAPDRIVTNRHVAERFRTLHLVYDATPAIMMTPARIDAAAANDVAVLRAAAPGIEPMALAGEDPPPGARVWVSGYAHERGPDSLADGLVLAAARVVNYMPGRFVGESGQVMRVDVPVRSGMSGGPVLDEAGRLAGVVFATDGPTQGLVVPVSTVRKVLRGGSNRPRTC
jgi:S1-C subfamily serine protease